MRRNWPRTQDAIHLNPKLFQRVSTIYKERQSLKLDPESVRLVEITYDQFVHAGANLSEAEKVQLKKLNEEIASLSTEFSNKLLAATKAGAYVTTDKAARWRGFKAMRKSQPLPSRPRGARSRATSSRCRTPRSSLTWSA